MHRMDCQNQQVEAYQVLSRRSPGLPHTCILPCNSPTEQPGMKLFAVRYRQGVDERVGFPQGRNTDRCFPVEGEK